MLVLSAHDRHALIWYSLPLPQDSSVCQLDKPQIFFIHSSLMSFGMCTKTQSSCWHSPPCMSCIPFSFVRAIPNKEIYK